MELCFCTLYSGSSGNASFISANGTAILVDAGVSLAAIQRALLSLSYSAAQVSALLITHEHIDHIKSAGVLSRKFDIPVYANARTWAAMEDKIGPLPLKNVRVFNTGQDFYIKDLGVYSFAIPHDAAEPVGYCFYCRGGKVCMMTDLGRVTDKTLSAAENSDVVLIESNHDVGMLKNGRYPAALKKRILGNRGHLSNEAAGEALLKLAGRGVRRAVLGHLSQDNNTEELALDTVRARLKAGGAEVDVTVAGRTSMSSMFKIV